jgi:hypothetical protein
MQDILKKISILMLFMCLMGIESIAQQTVQEYEIVQVKQKIYKEDGTNYYSDYKPNKTRTVKLLAGFDAPENSIELSKYGGWKEFKEEATGFFHVKKIGDRWWGIDPEGYRYFNIALNSITLGRSHNNEKAFEEKFGSSAKWIEQTIAMLQEYGFNSAGSWSDNKAIRNANENLEKPFPYTINLNFMSSYGKERGGTFAVPGHTGFPNSTIFVFDPEFEEFCDRHAKQLLETKDDPNLFGHFSDNELPFRQKSLDNYLLLPENDHGRLAAEAFLIQKGITSKDITDPVREEFLGLVADKYFSIVSKAIKKYDPNHQYIGSRFYSSEKNSEAFIRAASKYLDVLSFNYYQAWTPSEETMSNWEKWSGLPFIITEFYAKGEDSGLPNHSGAGFLVKTQEDRGLFYQNFNLALIEQGSCVGWHYFKYQDNDPEEKDAELSNIDANKGIVNLRYDPWEKMLDKMKELNTQVYPLIHYFDNKNQD